MLAECNRRITFCYLVLTLLFVFSVQKLAIKSGAILYKM